MIYQSIDGGIFNNPRQRPLRGDQKEQGQKDNNPAVRLNLGLFFAVGMDTLQDGHNVQLSRAIQRIFLSYSELERGRWKLNTGKFADRVEPR